MSDIQQLSADLLKALGINLRCGSITLNMNDAQLQSVKTETYQRVAKVAPKRTNA